MIEPAGAPSPPPTTTTPPPPTTTAPPPPPDPVPQTTSQAAAAEEEDESKLCVVCNERLRDATLVHGETGHHCCCMQCAQRLRQRGDTCPMCRQPIELVIRNFTS